MVVREGLVMKTELESASLTFHGLLGPAAAVLIGLAAAAGIFLLYFREQGRFGFARRVLMALLRVGVVGTALFLLMRPVLVAEERGERPRGVALLVDNSLSMTQRDQRLSVADRRRVAIAENRIPADSAVAEGEVPAGTSGNPSRADLVGSVLNHPGLDLARALERIGPLRAYVFGQRLRRVADSKRAEGDEPGEGETPAPSLPERLSAELRFEETRTALADALHEVLTRPDGDLPAAVVVMTDGRDNASSRTLEEAARECAARGIPLHFYGAGSSEVGNLELKDVVIPDTLFFDDIVSVPVRWRCRGFREGTAEIEVRLGDQVVSRREVTLEEGEDFRETLTFVPRKTGQADQVTTDLRVALRYRGEETFTEDNEQGRPVSLVDRKVRLLYVEGVPRWEYKFLQTVLIRDRRVKADFLLLEGDRRALQGGAPYIPEFPATRQELFDYDVLILGDVPSADLGPDAVAWIADFVREGGSLVLIAGRRHAPWSYHATPLAEVLPVEFGASPTPLDERARPQEYLPELTRAGGRAEMLSLADTAEESRAVWRRLPGFYWNAPVRGLRPGATALLVHPRRRALEEQAPVLATQHYGKGQVLFLGTDETWRWRYNSGDRHYGRFWGQVVYQMGLPHLVGTQKRIRLALDRTENVLHRPGYVYARVFDAEFKPYTGERVLARVEALEARAGGERFRDLVLEPVSGQPGEYRALLAHDATGRFTLRVREPAEASLDFRVVLPPQHELQVAGMDAAALQAAAAASGGAFYREEDLHRLAGNVVPRNASFTLHHEKLLWDWPVWLLFVALITVEWILRKFSNLS